MEETKTKNNAAEMDQLVARIEEVEKFENQLEAVAMMPKQSPQRYDAFLAMAQNGRALFFSEKSVTILKTKFEENTEESAFFRSIAASILSQHHASIGLTDEATFYQRAATDHGEHVTRKERKKRVILESRGMVTVGEYLDWLRKASTDRNHDIELPNSLVQMSQASFREELYGVYNMLLNLKETDFPKPPTLTSDFLANVKALPQSQQTFLVLESTLTELSDDIEKTCRRRAGYQEMFCSAPGDRREVFAQSPMNPFRNESMYLVFDVDLDRFSAGKKTRVLDLVLALSCGSNQTHQKNLLASLAMACLEPLEGEETKERFPLQRPQKVLLPTENDASHPQVRAFMSMMGFLNIGTADPALVVLSKQAMSPTTSPGHWMTQQAETPHLLDFVRGIGCGHCSLVGPKLQRCPCGKAYYCCKECQRAHWKDHHQEHKRVLARKQAKSKGDVLPVG